MNPLLTTPVDDCQGCLIFWKEHHTRVVILFSTQVAVHLFQLSSRRAVPCSTITGTWKWLQSEQGIRIRMQRWIFLLIRSGATWDCFIFFVQKYSKSWCIVQKYLSDIVTCYTAITIDYLDLTTFSGMLPEAMKNEVKQWITYIKPCRFSEFFYSIVKEKTLFLGFVLFELLPLGILVQGLFLGVVQKY